tara:strand:- start:324 stop:839 length:516 start_codon:yes stop_codon:yes gene_type:complete
MEEKIISDYKQPEPTLGQKVDRLTTMIEQGGLEKETKVKKFRMPMKGKVGKGKLKQGYATIMEISENNVVSFTKEVIKESTIKLQDTFHSIDELDILTYQSKPFLIIPKKSDRPYSPFNPNDVEDTTYGQRHIMSRMMNEALDKTKKMGLAGVSIGAIILVAAIAYAFLSG